MPRIKSDDAEISYQLLGDGPPIVLLHPFPVTHEFWLPAAQALLTRYRLIIPDLRGHGSSELGEGPATMQKHAADISRVMDDAGIDQAAFAAVSIGGYALFEFWRRYRERALAIVLCNTKAQADSAEARNARLKSAAEVMEGGTEPFFQSMLPKWIGETTRGTRPDLVQATLPMMRKMSANSVAMIQAGMAQRPDSVATLKTINVPALIVTGDEDLLTGPAEAELMRQNIAGSRLKIIPKAGHYSPWERPKEVGLLLREFFDSSLR
jgi:pimeloyl-ACP methyl ester carboxylesterase